MVDDTLHVKFTESRTAFTWRNGFLNCPFCGSVNVSPEYNDFDDVAVQCNDCYASGPLVDLGPLKREDRALRDAAFSKAVELWNTRTNEPPKPMTPRVQRLA